MSKPTILVVDDDAAIQEMLTLALEDEGYRVVRAADGDALPLARRERPDVLLLDVDMPMMDGIEVSNRLRSNPSTAGIPIVAMTSLPQRAMRDGMQADAWLPKPFAIDELYQVVDRLTARPR